MTVYVRLVVAVALLVLGFWAGWEWRDRSSDLAAAESAQAAWQHAEQAQRDARTNEQNTGRSMAEIGDKHEEDRQAAEAVPDAVVADLRAGNLRLRREWAGCETQRLSDAAAGARERDALAASRDTLAGEVVRIGRDADDQLAACQAVVKADRVAINGTEAKP